jgi:hypothetical protein
MENIYRIIASLVLCTCSGMPAHLQPYIDVANGQYVHSPDRGLTNQKSHTTRLNQSSISSTLPFQFKNGQDAIIISPSFEKWSGDINPSDNPFENQYGVAVVASFLKTLSNPDWSILPTVIIKRNGYTIAKKDNWQVGTAILVQFKANENLRYKIGVYANKEFFGVFIMPLLGIDWELSKKTNLFGILPGSLTLEHKLKKRLYTGASFRAITASYRLDTGYTRINENRLGAFLDYYVSKKLVLNAEAGHSILRKLKSGVKGKFQADWNASDNAYFKIGVAYRVRLR